MFAALACGRKDVADDDAGNSAGSTAATSEMSASSDSETAGGTTGVNDPLPAACTEWCEAELACHPDAFPSVTQCVELCLQEVENEQVTQECKQAIADWYLCRAALECNAPGCENEETMSDAACGGDGG